MKNKTNEWIVKATEIPVEHESSEQKRPLLQQQPLEAEYSSDDDIASPELDLHDNDQCENKLDDEDGLLSEEDEEADEEEVSSEGHDYDSESSVDDSDLLKRLEEKYGKLPQRNDDDVDVDDDDDNDDWTSIT